MGNKEYVAYYRISTKKQKGLGLDAQKAIVEHFANKDNAIIVKEFTEIESGKDTENRPELKEALHYCKTHQATLIVAKLDRLSRNVEDTFKIKRELANKLICCDLPDTDSLTLSIFAGLAMRERELIAIRTRQALQAKKQKGYILGKPGNFTDEGRKLGVAKIKEKARNNQNNTRAKSMIAKCKQQGMSLSAIATELNSNDFMTSRGKKFTKMSVKRLV